MPPAGEFHGVLCSFIAHLLWGYVAERGKGHVCSNATGLLIKKKPATVRGPDIMLFDERRALANLSRMFAERVPKLVVEVLSPSDRPSRLNRRVSQYLKRRIALIWLVDPEERKVTVYRPGKDLYVLAEADELTGEGVLPGLRFRVADLFALPGQCRWRAVRAWGVGVPAMRQEDVIKSLHDQPFRPFRVHLSNGDIHEVRHPELVWVTRGSRMIALPSTDLPVPANYYLTIALVHIDKTDYLTPLTPSQTTSN